MIAEDSFYKKKGLSGVYSIENTHNGRTYIGSTKDVYKRYHNHKSMLKKGNHFNIHLQDEYSKFGCDCFIFRVLEYTGLDKDFRYDREQYYMEKHKNTYNIADTSRGISSKQAPKGKDSPTYGRRHTKEEIEKMRNAKSGIFDGKKNPFFGMKHTDETKRRLSKYVGEDKGNSVLTSDDVLSMRQDYADGEKNMAELGRKYGVGRGTVRSVIRRFTWKHL